MAVTAARDVGEGAQRHDPLGVPGHEHQPGGRDHGEGALRSAQQAGEVVPGVVLDQPVHVAQHAAVRGDGLDAHHLAPGGSPPQHVHAARIGRHRSADRRRPPRRQIDAVGEAVGGDVGLQGLEGDSGPRIDLGGHVVDRAHAIEPTQRQDDLPVQRDPAADEAGVPTLGHDRDPLGIAERENLGDLGGVTRPDHRRGRLLGIGRSSRPRADRPGRARRGRARSRQRPRRRSGAGQEGWSGSAPWGPIVVRDQGAAKGSARFGR